MEPYLLQIVMVTNFSVTDLIIDQFIRENLYVVPRVTVSTFSSEKYIEKLQSVFFLHLLMKFQSNAQRKSYDDFPQVACLECNSGVCKKTNFLKSYLCKYSAKSSEIQTRSSTRFLLKWVFFVTSETSQKTSYSENSMMTCLQQRNPRIQSSDTKCYETSSRKDRSTPSNSASSRGKPPLHYINEQFLDDTNEKTSFLDIRV